VLKELESRLDALVAAVGGQEKGKPHMLGVCGGGGAVVVRWCGGGAVMRVRVFQ
jgi:hypothetical protein